MVANNKYKPQLDGLRAFCILFTIAQHTPGRPEYIVGSIGVDLFFALSGWLITWLMLEERAKAGAINIQAFYIRRAFRILPLYFLTIALYAAASFGLKLLNDPTEWEAFKSVFPYLISMNSEYRPKEVADLFGHAWTLGIEEKFYILWPAAFIFLRRKDILAFLFCGIIFSGLIAISPNAAFGLRGYAGIGFGALTAVMVHRNIHMRFIANHNATASISLFGIALMYCGAVSMPHNYGWNIGASFFGALMVAGLWFSKESLIARFLTLAPIAYAGKLTFSLYLFHLLIIQAVLLIFIQIGVSPHFWMVIAVTYSVLLPICAFVHIAFEIPLIKLGRHFALNLNRQRLAKSY